MLVLAWPLGKDEALCCAKCTFKEVEDFIHIFLLVVRPSEVEEMAVCPRCGGHYGDRECMVYAEKMLKILKGE